MFTERNNQPVAIDLAAKTRTEQNPIGELKKVLDRASVLVAEIHNTMGRRPQAPLPNAIAHSADALRIAKLESELEAVQSHAHELAERLVESERQVERLMNLYVVIYQLHGTLLPEEVQATIVEIAINLLGARRVALLLLDDDEGRYFVASGEGLDDRSGDPFMPGNRYDGGDPLVDAALAGGALQIAEPSHNGRGAVAAVPLVIQEVVIGALVLLDLLAHRPALGRDDRELLELLGAHAASALVAAQAYSDANRKIHTLEALVKLVQGR